MVGDHLPVFADVDQIERMQAVLLIDVDAIVNVFQRENNARLQT